MNKRKSKSKIIMALIAVVLVIGIGTAVVSELTKGDVSYVMRYGDEEITPGMYVGYTVEYYINGISMLDSSTDYFSQTINDMSLESWITVSATEAAQTHLAVAVLAAEYGIELDDEDIADAEDLADYKWTYYGTLYEASGCSYESVLKISEYDILYAKVFEFIYSDGGELEVPEDEIKEYYEENYAEVKSLSINYYDIDYETISEDEKAERIAMLEAFQVRLDAGEDFDVIAEEYIEWVNETFETELENTIDYSIISANDSDVDSTVLTAIFDCDVNGTTITEDASSTYLIQRYDIYRDADNYDLYKDTVLAELKGDEYQDFCDDKVTEMDIDMNTNAISYYSPLNITY